MCHSVQNITEDDGSAERNDGLYYLTLGDKNLHVGVENNFVSVHNVSLPDKALWHFRL